MQWAVTLGATRLRSIPTLIHISQNYDITQEYYQGSFLYKNSTEVTSSLVQDVAIDPISSNNCIPHMCIRENSRIAIIVES